MSTVTVEFPTETDEWAEFGGHELDAKVAELNVAQRRIEAAIVFATNHAEGIGHHTVDGHRTVGSWLMATTNCSRSEATARQRSARMLRSLTTTAEAFAAGRVGIGQVRELAGLAANPRSGDQLEGSEDLLLEAAQTLEFRDFRVVTQRWEQLADADGAHLAHESVHEHRDARCGQVGDECRFETSHGTVQGTSMREVFEAFCQAEFDRDWSWVKGTYGDEAAASLLPRTAAQRRADAFVAVVSAAAGAGTGDGRPVGATANLVCDIDQFEQYVEHEITGREVDIDPTTVRDRRCETTDGAPVDPRQLVAAAFLGRIRFVVVDGAGVIVHAGRKRKLFTGALREAIMAIDPVCGWLGCNLRSQIADIDHIVPRSHGGPTDSSNGKIFCHKHNVDKHVKGYQVERRPDGAIDITRPDGTKLDPRHVRS